MRHVQPIRHKLEPVCVYAEFRREFIIFRWRCMRQASFSRLSLIFLYKRQSRLQPEKEDPSSHAIEIAGAGDGNRTRTASLEGWNSTIELHPRGAIVYQIGAGKQAFHTATGAKAAPRAWIWATRAVVTSNRRLWSWARTMLALPSGLLSQGSASILPFRASSVR